MKLLIISATLPEIHTLLSSLSLEEGRNRTHNRDITVLITGAGMVATAFEMGKLLAGQAFDLAVNLGIAGSFDRRLKIGEVVQVQQDTLAELGAEDGDAFIPMEKLGFGISVMKPLLYPLPMPLSLSKVAAITVNTVHGCESSIAKTLERFSPQVESMEGAAFLYACAKAGLPSVQIRSISNYVERRDRGKWDIPLAIKNLNLFAEEFIGSLFADPIGV